MPRCKFPTLEETEPLDTLDDLSSGTGSSPMVSQLPPSTYFAYQHTPPRSMAVHKRWPACFEAQATPDTYGTTLVDIWIWIHSFLDADTQGLLTTLMNVHQLGPTMVLSGYIAPGPLIGVIFVVLVSLHPGAQLVTKRHPPIRPSITHGSTWTPRIATRPPRHAQNGPFTINYVFKPSAHLLRPYA